MSDAGVAGPWFVSVGGPTQLTRFLELNPTVSRDRTFVDPSKDVAGYKSLGLRPDFSGGEGVRIGPPEGIDWLSYLGNVTAVSPQIENNQDLGKVTQQGGTFILEGEDKVLFASADRLPGDEPRVNDVLRAVGA
mmetsp:Transcript_125963/g.268751  ORF Transcript_125963/g.268751 Transcript_125963/m.268751 type:complete len:134 (+) Transcript_125963:1090-1491(+)